jgi:hypothetical protein
MKKNDSSTQHKEVAMRKSLLGISFAPLLMASLCFAQTAIEQKDPGHAMFTPGQIPWQAGPAAFPPGAQLAVLDGDPSQTGGLYTIGLKMPDDYRLPPHWHPMDANVTVVRGTFVMGLGETFDPAQGTDLTPGSFMRIPKEVRHYEWTKGETIIYVHGLGPLETMYVNPADDPRQKANRKE